MKREMMLLKALDDIDEQLLVEETEQIKHKFKTEIINTNNLKYVLVPVCIFVLTIVGYKGLKNNNFKNNIRNSHIENGIEEGLTKIININKAEDLAISSLDADMKIVNNVMIPYFEFLAGLAIPEDFDNKEDMRAIYTRSGVNPNNYDTLNNYEFHYRNTLNNREIILSFSDKYEPLRGYYIENKGKASKIGNIELIITQYKDMYIVKFKAKDINFDIETTDITEQELIALLESVINGLERYRKE